MVVRPRILPLRIDHHIHMCCNEDVRRMARRCDHRIVNIDIGKCRCRCRAAAITSAAAVIRPRHVYTLDAEGRSIRCLAVCSASSAHVFVTNTACGKLAIILLAGTELAGETTTVEASVAQVSQLIGHHVTASSAIVAPDRSACHTHSRWEVWSVMRRPGPRMLTARSAAIGCC